LPAGTFFNARRGFVKIIFFFQKPNKKQNMSARYSAMNIEPTSNTGEKKKKLI